MSRLTGQVLVIMEVVGVDGVRESYGGIEKLKSNQIGLTHRSRQRICFSICSIGRPALES
jgi:hypothetical protein